MLSHRYRLVLVALALLALVPAGGCKGETSAFERAKQAARKQPNSVDALMTLGTAYFDKEMYNDAYIAFNKAKELDPKNAKALHKLGATNLKLGDADEGIKLLKSALAGKPDFVDAHVSMARAYLMKEEPKKAITHLERALKEDPTALEARISLVYARYMAKDLNGALATAKQAVEDHPASADAHYVYSEMLLTNGDMGQAERQLRTTMSLDAKHAKAMFGLATVLLREKRGFEEARNLAQGSAEIEPADGAPAAAAAWALYLLGRKAEGLDELKKVCLDHPLNHLNWQLFANALTDAGFEDEAKLAAKYARRAAPRRVSEAQRALAASAAAERATRAFDLDKNKTASQAPESSAEPTPTTESPEPEGEQASQ